MIYPLKAAARSITAWQAHTDHKSAGFPVPTDHEFPKGWSLWVLTILLVYYNLKTCFNPMHVYLRWPRERGSKPPQSPSCLPPALPSMKISLTQAIMNLKSIVMQDRHRPRGAICITWFWRQRLSGIVHANTSWVSREHTRHYQDVIVPWCSAISYSKPLACVSVRHPSQSNYESLYRTAPASFCTCPPRSRYTQVSAQIEKLFRGVVPWSKCKPTLLL